MISQEELLSNLLDITRQMKDSLGQNHELFLQLQHVRDKLFSELNMRPEFINEHELNLIHEITTLDEEIIQELNDMAKNVAHDIIRIGHALNSIREHYPPAGESYIDVKR